MRTAVALGLVVAGISLAVALAKRGEDAAEWQVPVSALEPAPPALRTELAGLGRIVLQTGATGFEVRFSGPAGKSADISTIGADGSGRRLLTPPRGAGVDVAPAWSPDGETIAFASWRHGSGDLHVMNADGGAVRRLTSLPGDELFPQWAPDGSRILFFSGFENAFSDLWVVAADGGEPQLLVEHTNGVASWGPHGRIATIADGALFVLGPEYGQELAPAGALNNDLAWSPAGSPILFTRGGFSSSTLFAIDPDGLLPRRFAAQGSSPIWSPDGSRLLLQDADGTCCGAIAVVRADGSGLRKLADWAQPADWSPDGSYVLWLDVFGPGDRHAIAVTPAKGGQSYRLTPYLDEEIARLDWAPR